MFWRLRFCFLGSFPEEVLWKLDSLRGTSHWKAAQGKPSDRGARIQRYLSPTRQGLHNGGLNGPGWETQTLRNPSEGNYHLSIHIYKRESFNS